MRMLCTLVIIVLLVLCNGELTIPCPGPSAVTIINESSRWDSPAGVIAIRDCRDSAAPNGIVLRVERGNLTLLIVNSSVLRVDVAVQSNVINSTLFMWSTLNLTIRISDCTIVFPSRASSSSGGVFKTSTLPSAPSYPLPAWWKADWEFAWISFVHTEALVDVWIDVDRVVFISQYVGGLLTTFTTFSSDVLGFKTALQNVAITIANSRFSVSETMSLGPLIALGVGYVHKLHVSFINSTYSRSSPPSIQQIALVKLDVYVVTVPMGNLKANSFLSFIVENSSMTLTMPGSATLADIGEANVVTVTSNWSPRINGPERTSNVSFAARGSFFNFSSQRPKILGLNAGLGRDILFHLESCIVLMYTAGPRFVNTSGVSSYLFSVSNSINALENMRLVCLHVRTQSFVQFGDFTSAANDLGNVNIGIMALQVNHSNVDILLSNVSCRINGLFEESSSFAQLFAKSIMVICFISGASKNVSISVYKSSIFLEWSHYCTGLRNAIDEPGTIVRSNAGAVSFYLGFVGFNQATVDHLKLTVEDGLVDVVSFPYRQACPLSRTDGYVTTAQFPPFPLETPLPLPMLISIVPTFLCMLGVDPLVDRVLQNVPFPSEYLDHVTKFGLTMRDVNIFIVRPRLKINMYQPPIEYIPANRVPAVPFPANTVLRTGLLVMFGLKELKNLHLETQLADRDASTNASVVIFDGNENMDSIHINVSRVVSQQPQSVENGHRPFVEAAANDGDLVDNRLVMAVALMTLNASNVSGMHVTFRDLGLNLGPFSRAWSGNPIPPVLFFNNVTFLTNAVVSIIDSNVTGYNRLIGGSNYVFRDTSGGSSAFQLSLGCVLWNGVAMPASKIGPMYDVKDILARSVIVNGCPELVPSWTPSIGSGSANVTMSVELPLPRKPPLSMGAGATAVAAVAIASGGLISSASVMAMQRTISLLRLAKCDGPVAMEDDLDIFTNPLGLHISSWDGGQANASDIDTADSDVGQTEGSTGDIEYGAAYRGAVVGNLAVFWFGGGLLAVAVVLVVRWYRRPLWSAGDAAGLLHLPGNMYPMLVAPLLQPILSSALALLLHSRSGADWAVGIFGIVCTTAVCVAICGTVLPCLFYAVPKRVQHIHRLKKAVTDLARGPTRTTTMQYVRSGARRLWLQLVLLLFVVEYEWANKSKKKFTQFVGWCGGVFEPLRPNCQWVVIAELVVVVEASITAAIMPSSEAGCKALAIVDAVSNALLVILYVVRRPYATMYDLIAAVAMTALTTMTAILVAGGVDDETMESVAEDVNIFAFALVIFGVLQIVADSLTLKRRLWGQLWTALQRFLLSTRNVVSFWDLGGLPMRRGEETGRLAKVHNAYAHQTDSDLLKSLTSSNRTKQKGVSLVEHRRQSLEMILELICRKANPIREDHASPDQRLRSTTRATTRR